ncbi:hypothetical protein RJ639_043593 [Escallonia herrerae]|uniref:O-fucosyltransferase family protein n=1 Tax=Escallonia herrerae TaxID=1293975 RepID=A0AA88WIP1_9ASTE|nr:hypothetical protein RJ639_043593 [Escallonia herrerae]
MVNLRASVPLKTKLLPRKVSPYSIALYLILLCGFSISLFFFFIKDILKDEEIPVFFEDPQPEQTHKCASIGMRCPDTILLWLIFCSCKINCGKLLLAMVYVHVSSLLQNIEDEYPIFSNFAKLHALSLSLSLIFFTMLAFLLLSCGIRFTCLAAQGGDRYITVKSNGGLNQMRTGISDMVAVAHIMNATLVIPQLDKRSFWKDTSTFSDIFDELQFITTLQGDVRIVKELPKELGSVPRARKHLTSWSGMGYYEEMTQLWKDYQAYHLAQVIHVAKSDSRLANNDLPVDIQRLRCRALYHSLRFSTSIENLGQKLVERLRSHGKRYIALHLRYEKDMLSFTGCTYGLTNAESEELRVMRENTGHWKIKKINSTEQRRAGSCPLTPKEVGIFLQALGYPTSTLIYIAAGEIYGGDAHLSELTSRFPNVVYKETIATQKELREFADHASQTAALDYIISIESDIFIPSYTGNMARAVERHRRFLGHRKTITPDRFAAISGVLSKSLISWKVESLKKDHHYHMRCWTRTRTVITTFTVLFAHQNYRQGAPRIRRGAPLGIKGRARFRFEDSFYQNPYPECICSTKNTVRQRNRRFQQA